MGAHTLIQPTHCSQDNNLTPLTGVSLISRLVSVIWVSAEPGTLDFTSGFKESSHSDICGQAVSLITRNSYCDEFFV